MSYYWLIVAYLAGMVAGLIIRDYIERYYEDELRGPHDSE